MQQKNQLLSQQILALDEKISDLQFDIQALKTELANLDQDTLVPYWEKRTGVQFNKALIGISIAGGFLVGGAVGAGVLQAVAPTFLSALAGGGLGAGLTWLRPSLEYTMFEYSGLPFEQVDAESKVGEFEVLECSKERGIYRAKFTGDLNEYAEPKVTILLKKNAIPSNVERIRTLRTELYESEARLQRFEDQKAEKVAAKKQNTQQQVLAEATAKRAQGSLMGRPSYSEVPFQLPAAAPSANAPARAPASVEIVVAPEVEVFDNFFASMN